MTLPRERFRFGLKQISDVYGPDLILRTYLEHGALRFILQQLAAPKTTACELGCGYGRMTVVLTEFFEKVFGFERESEFVTWGRRLGQRIEIQQIAALSQIPVTSGFFDFAMTFTCLQHLHETELIPALNEAHRILKPGGHLLICEETDGYFQDRFEVGEFGTVSRSVERYAELLPQMKLLQTSKRPPEPGYPRSDVGTFLLFRKPSGES